LGFWPPVPGGGESVAGAFGHEGVFELGDGAEDLEEHPADDGGGVDALIQHDEVHAAGVQVAGQLDEVFLARTASSPLLLRPHRVNVRWLLARSVEVGGLGEFEKMFGVVGCGEGGQGGGGQQAEQDHQVPGGRCRRRPP